jgi:hypothetical protein
MSKIVIEFPDDRAQAGILRLVNENDQTVAGPFMACGKADDATAAMKGNLNRSSTLPFGDTPLGDYQVEGVVPTGSGTNYEAGSYGANGAIWLTPASGEAMLAARAGRTGLMIHGGELSANGGLRPANGCVRLSNEDMQSLLTAIAKLSMTEESPDSCTIKMAIGWGGVGVEIGKEEGYSEADPPPVASISLSPMPERMPIQNPGQLSNSDLYNRQRRLFLQSLIAIPLFAGDLAAGEQHDRDPPERHQRSSPEKTCHDRGCPDSPHERTPHERTAPSHDREPHERYVSEQAYHKHTHQGQNCHNRDCTPHERTPPVHDRESHDRT